MRVGVESDGSRELWSLLRSWASHKQYSKVVLIHFSVSFCLFGKRPLKFILLLHSAERFYLFTDAFISVMSYGVSVIHLHTFFIT